MSTHSNDLPPFNDPLLELIDGYFNGTLTPDAQQRLDERLRTDAEARGLYLRRAEIEAYLTWRLRGGEEHGPADEPLPQDVIDDASPPPQAPFPQVAASAATVAPADHGDLQTVGRNVLDWRRHRVLFGLLTLSLTLLLWVGFWAIFLTGVNDPVADAPEADDGMVARLAWIDGAHWQGFVPSGKGMRAGRKLELVAGLAELRYATGAIVVLQGPAEFTVGATDESLAPSRNSGYLARGKLLARCQSNDSKGFTIATPSARVEDLGTEFGVEVGAGGEEIVGVLEGKVVLHTPAADGTTRRQTLYANQEVTLTQNAVAVAVRVSEYASDRFVGRIRGRLQAVRKEPAEQGDLRFVVYHDLGGEPSPGNITTRQDVAALVDLINFTDGSDTGIRFRVSGGKLDTRTVDTAGNLVTRPPNAGTPAGELFLASRIDLDDGIVHIQGGTMTFTFTDLDPTLLYDVAIYGDRNSNRDGVERFTLGGAAAATNRSSTGIVRTYITDMNTRPNASDGHVARWTDIAPGGDGSIRIDISTSGTNIAYLSAIRLAEHAAKPNDANKESE